MAKSPQIHGNWARSDASATAPTVDRKRRHARENVERILARSQWLPESDRQLIVAVYSDGKRFTDLAALTESSPRVMRDRVAKLVVRVSSELFGFVALHCAGWPPAVRRAAETCVFQGLSIREASIALGTSYHNVRRLIDMVRTMHRTGMSMDSMHAVSGSVRSVRRGVGRASGAAAEWRGGAGEMKRESFATSTPALGFDSDDRHGDRGRSFERGRDGNRELDRDRDNDNDNDSNSDFDREGYRDRDLDD